MAFLTAYLVSGGDVLWRAVRNIFRGHVFDENFLMSLATVGAVSYTHLDVYKRQEGACI